MEERATHCVLYKTPAEHAAALKLLATNSLVRDIAQEEDDIFGLHFLADGRQYAGDLSVQLRQAGLHLFSVTQPCVRHLQLCASVRCRTLGHH